MKQDERAPFVQALQRARVSAYAPGEFVGQESFMRAGEIRALADRAGIAPGVSVLDLCCGVGGPGRFITRELGCTYLGVDFSSSAIDIARESAGDLPCRFEVSRIPPIPAGPFDVVLLFETMLAFPEKQTLLQEISRALTTGGRFAFTMEEGLPLTEAERESMPDADTVWLTPLAEMLTCLERVGLAVRWQDDCSRSHRAVADSLIDAFAADAADIAAQIGRRALEELLAAHGLWSDWLREGRVRKIAFVAEKTETPRTPVADIRTAVAGRSHTDVVHALRAPGTVSLLAVLDRDEEARRMISNDESPLPDTEVHYLRSEHVGDEFKVLVGLCGSCESAPPPVVFLGDPCFQFGTAVEMTRLLNLVEHLPALLVVGVGYRTTAIAEILDLRSRDFTPTVDLAGTAKDPAMTAGAGRFLAFLRDELKPWVGDRYGVDPDDSAFFGDSYGGLFATYVLLSEPATFRRYGIGSPSFWWDGKVMFEREAEYARAHDDLSAKVFFSVGAYENPEGRERFREQLPVGARAKAEAEDEADPPADMVADTERMVALLRGRAYPSLEIECEVLPGEYHETAPPLNLSRSLRYLFDAPR